MLNNMQKMREAFDKIGNACAWVAENCNDQQTAKYMNDVIAIVQSALAMPMRNCDVGTAEEQNKRFGAHCVHTCDGCKCDHRLFQKEEMTECAIAWAQMPYEGGKER